MLLEVKGHTPRVEVYYHPPIALRGPSEIALIGFNTFHGESNVNQGNNVIAYTRTQGLRAGVENISEIPVGFYSADELVDLVKIELKKDISIVVNKQSGKIDLKVEARDLVLNFDHPRSVGKLLGFVGLVNWYHGWVHSSEVRILPTLSFQIQWC